MQAITARSKAGAILKSSLVYDGWSFPPCRMVHSDEKHLFDVEVRIKLGHSSAAQLVFDVLVDYPPSLLMSRVGLIEVILNIIGSAISVDTILGPSASPGCLKPRDAVRWMGELVVKAVALFHTHVEGSLSSSIPCSYNDKVAQQAEEWDRSPSAADLARSLYELRFPISSPLSSTISIVRTANDGVSLSGLAFATFAAVLPLFRLRDLSMLSTLSKLITTVLPYVIEPAAPSGVEDKLMGDEDGRVIDLNFRRMQHLLQRLDMILDFFGTSNVTMDLYQQCCAMRDGFGTDNSTASPSTDGEEEKDSSTSETHAYHATVLFLCHQLCSVIPLESFHCNTEGYTGDMSLNDSRSSSSSGRNGEGKKKKCLQIGVHVEAIIMYLCSNNWCRQLWNMDQLDALLAMLHPSQSRMLHDIRASVSSLEALHCLCLGQGLSASELLSRSSGGSSCNYSHHESVLAGAYSVTGEMSELELIDVLNHIRKHCDDSLRLLDYESHYCLLDTDVEAILGTIVCLVIISSTNFELRTHENDFQLFAQSVNLLVVKVIEHNSDSAASSYMTSLLINSLHHVVYRIATATRVNLCDESVFSISCEPHISPVMVALDAILKDVYGGMNSPSVVNFLKQGQYVHIDLVVQQFTTTSAFSEALLKNALIPVTYSSNAKREVISSWKSSLSLVDIFLSHIYDSDVFGDAGSLTKWMSLYPLLKLLEWSATAPGTRSPSQHSRGADFFHDHPVVVRFMAYVEELCFRNQVHEMDNLATLNCMFHKTLLLGLFHQSDAVRQYCTLMFSRLISGLLVPDLSSQRYSDVLETEQTDLATNVLFAASGYYSEIPSGIRTTADSATFGVFNDPFQQTQGSNAIFLEGWTSEEDQDNSDSFILQDGASSDSSDNWQRTSPSASRGYYRRSMHTVHPNCGSTSLFSHAEIKKLSTIAFNSIHDIKVRVSALRQLHQLLVVDRNDNHLLYTCEKDWALGSAEKCLAEIAICAHTMTTARLRPTTCNSDLPSLSQTAGPAETVFEFSLLCLLLVRTLAVHLDYVVDAFGLFPAGGGNDDTTNVTLDVTCLLKVLLTHPSTITNYLSSTMRQIGVMRFLTAQILQVWCGRNVVPSAFTVDQHSYMSADTSSTVVLSPFLTSWIRNVKIHESDKLASLPLDDSASDSSLNSVYPSIVDDSVLNCIAIKADTSYFNRLGGKYGTCCDDDSSNMADVNVVSIALKALTGRSVSTASVFRELGSRLCSSIENSTQHDHFRDRLRMLHLWTRCLSSRRSGTLTTALVPQGSFLLRAFIYDILQKIPRSISELKSLTIILELVIDIANALQMKHGDSLTEFYDLVMDCVSGPLLPHLFPCSQQKQTYNELNTMYFCDDPTDEDDFNKQFDNNCAGVGSASGTTPDLQAHNDLVSQETVRVCQVNFLTLLNALLGVGPVSLSENTAVLKSLVEGDLFPRLIHVLCQEVIPVAVRQLAGNCLNTIALHFPDAFVVSMKRRPSAAATMARAAAQRSFDDRSSVEEKNVLVIPMLVEELVMCVKFPRSPDSLKDSVTTNLILRLLCQHYKIEMQLRRQSNDLSVGNPTTLLADIHESHCYIDVHWTWLIRCMVDRRAEVRVLATELGHLVRESYCLALQQLLPASRSIVGDCGDVPSASDASFLSALRACVRDESECTAVRFASVSALRSIVLPQLVADTSGDETEEMAAVNSDFFVIIDTLTHLVVSNPAIYANNNLLKFDTKVIQKNLNNSMHYTSFAACDALQEILIILQSTKNHGTIVDMMKKMKLFLHVSNSIGKEYANCFVDSAVNRFKWKEINTGLYDASTFGHSIQQKYFSNQRGDPTSGCKTSLLNEHTRYGFDLLWDNYKSSQKECIVRLHLLACKIFGYLALNASSAALTSVSGTIFSDCVQQTLFVDRVIDCCVSDLTLLPVFEYYCNNNSSECDMLELSRVKLMGQSRQKLLQQQCFLIKVDILSHIIKSNTPFLNACEDNAVESCVSYSSRILHVITHQLFMMNGEIRKQSLNRRNGQQLGDEIIGKVITSSLRLICLVISSTQWNQLAWWDSGFSTVQHKVLSLPMKLFLSALLLCREAVSNTVTASDRDDDSFSRAIVLLSRIDFCISLILSQSNTVKDYLYGGCTDMWQKIQRSVLLEAAEKIRTATCVMNNEAIQESSGTSTADIRGSLKLLHKKNPRRAGHAKMVEIIPRGLTTTRVHGSASSGTSSFAAPTSSNITRKNAPKDPLMQRQKLSASMISPVSVAHDEAGSVSSRATKSRTKPTGFKDSCKSTSNDDDLSRNDQLFMLSLWSALVLIQNSLPNCPQAQLIMRTSASTNFFAELPNLISFYKSAGLSVCNKTNVSDNGEGWTPAKLQVLMSALMTCGASMTGEDSAKVTYGSTYTSSLGKSYSPTAASSSATATPTSDTSFAHQLLSMGLASGNIPNIRYASLGLVRCIVSNRSMSSTTQKLAFSNSLSAAIESSLSPNGMQGFASHRQGPGADDFRIHLLDTLASCLCCESIGTDVSAGHHTTSNILGEAASQLNVLPLPQLLQCLWNESSGKNFDQSNSKMRMVVCRTIAYIASFASGSIGGSSPRGGAVKKVATHVSTAECVAMVVEHLLNSYAAVKVSNDKRGSRWQLNGLDNVNNATLTLLQYQSSGDLLMALLALWVVLHYAEKVRAMVKRSKDFAQLCHVISTLLSLFYSCRAGSDGNGFAENEELEVPSSEGSPVHYSISRNAFERMINALHILLQ